MNPTANKVGMMEIMFEKFGVNRLQYGMQALMSLFAEGMTTAMLLDCGDGVSHCIPVFDGNIIKSSFERLDIAGRHVTTHLLKLLHQRGYAFNSSSDFEIVREIKEKFCFVSGDIKMENKLALETCIHEK
jgi:actin-related protein 2